MNWLVRLFRGSDRTAAALERSAAAAEEIAVLFETARDSLAARFGLPAAGPLNSVDGPAPAGQIAEASADPETGGRKSRKKLETPA